MKKILLITMATACISACNLAAPRYEYYKQGVTPKQRTDELYDCEFRVKTSPSPQHEISGLIDICMKGKGFRMRRVDPFDSFNRFGDNDDIGTYDPHPAQRSRDLQYFRNVRPVFVY